MKRTLLLAALFLVLGASAWYAFSNKNQKSTRVSWDMDFAIQNTSDIGKIFIADRKGETATLERKGDKWIYNGKYTARATAVGVLLETIQKINVKYIPPNQSIAPMVKNIAAQGIKVEIYDRDNKPMKTYYIGDITNDEQGTVMIMEGSEQPYVMHIPSFIGTLRVRYLLGDDQWRDRNVFAEKPEEIEKITVQYPQERTESFILEKIDDKYLVRPYYSTTAVSKNPQRKGVAEGYIIQFEGLGSEAFESTNPIRDSVLQLVPSAIVSLKKTDGSEKTVRFWPTETSYEPQTGKPYIVRYFADVDNESFMLTQHRVFGPIFRGYSFFFE